MDWNTLLNPATLTTLVPIFGVVWLIIASVAKHRERMAMIEKGMDPDAAERLQKERLAMIKRGINPDAVPQSYIEPRR